MSLNLSDAIVQGEAIESDDEYMTPIPAHLRKDSKNLKLNVEEYKGTVYSGEAPESEDEIVVMSNVKLAVGREADESNYSIGKSSNMRRIKKENSVFQTILAEKNFTFWDHLNTFLKSSVVTASSQTQAAEQLLVQTQVKLQATSRILKQGNDTADQILHKCRDILLSNFLPEVNV